jgi:heterodisulfide reductase subunit B
VLAQVNYTPSPELAVEHLLTTITDQAGIEAVSEAVVRPLEGLKVVCYYGCVITRPPELTGVTDYEYPMSMDHLMEALGATCLDWSYKTECCGGSLGLSQLPLALEMSRKVLRNAKEVGADAVVIACPLCNTNMDARQRQIGEQFGEVYDVPILYFTELMGLAFGLEPAELGLDKHAVSAEPLLQAKGLWSGVKPSAGHLEKPEVVRGD